jgi:hypothetical protein
MCARTCVWHYFMARYSARRSKADDASKTSRGSWMAGRTRVNDLRSGCKWATPISCTSYVCHPAPDSVHPLLRCGRLTLLMKIHSDLSTSVVVGVLVGSVANGRGAVGGRGCASGLLV